MTKILVVGGGLTAAVTTSLLKSAGSKAPVVTVWDKAKTVGGRMSTLKCRFNPDLTADLGAQYISQTPSSNRHVLRISQHGLNTSLSLYSSIGCFMMNL